MVERRGGLGGFGGITSDRTDQRKGRYHPHKNITRHENYLADETQVVCLDCLQRWTHPRGEGWNSGPAKCEKAAK